MAANPMRGVRLSDDLIAEAQANPEVADFDLSRMLRVGLALVAGHPMSRAIELSKGNKRGPAPKAERERESAGVAA
jgi:hypothetical protein